MLEIFQKEYSVENGEQTYHGPCPPDKRHHYFFKLYALNNFLFLKSGVTKIEIEIAMKGHILRQAQLVGTYDRTDIQAK